MDEKFYYDTLKQLKQGLDCYVFNKEHAKEIQKEYKRQTGLMFNIKQLDKDYILLKPIRKWSGKNEMLYKKN